MSKQSKTQATTPPKQTQAKKRFKAKRPKSKLFEFGDILTKQLNTMAAVAGCPEQERLIQLWLNWKIVMGEYAEMAYPLGHKRKTLLIGAEDSMAMSELVYVRQDILLRANAFMEEEFFTEVQLQLIINGKTLLDSVQDNPFLQKPPRENTPLVARGTYLDSMDPDSPIARCYRAYTQPAVPRTRQDDEDQD